MPKSSVTCAVLILLLACPVSATDYPQADSSENKTTSQRPGWIMSAADDEQRFYRIEKYLRGFDQSMWEVGERYQQLKTAISRDNRELAQYHWRKIRKTIINGLMKRPKRAANAHAIFLDQLWPDVNQALTSAKTRQINSVLIRINNSCIACHIAEGVPFVNNQPMFDLNRQ